jgi:hypothetical protein
LVRWPHPSGKRASIKGGSVMEPTALVPRQPRERAPVRVRPDNFTHGESKKNTVFARSSNSFF